MFPKNRLCVVPLCILASVSGMLHASEKTEDENLSLGDIFELSQKVSGISKSQESLAIAPMSVYVVDQRELQNWGVQGLYEIMQRVPGYSFYNTDFYGQYGVIGRGLQSIWRYGLSIELMPWVDFGHWTFTPSFFKNMEIARGPGGGITWGSSAEAGLINLNIRDDLDGLQLATAAGNLGRRVGEVMYGRKFEGGSFFAGFHNEQQDPFIQNEPIQDANEAAKIYRNQYRQNGIQESSTFLTKFSYKGAKVLAVFDQAHHQAPSLWFGGKAAEEAIITNLGEKWGDHLDNMIYRLEYEIPHMPEGWNLSLYRNFYRKSWYVANLATDNVQKEADGFQLEYAPKQGQFSLVLGGDLWGRYKRFSPSITSAWGKDVGIDWYEGTKTPKVDTFQNIFAQTKVNLSNDWKFILGIRADRSKEEGRDEQNLVSGPRLGLIYHPTAPLVAKYLYSVNKRAPQGNEIQSSTPEPEVLKAHELSTIYQNNVWDTSVTLFTQRLDDQITRVNDGSFNEFKNTGGLVTDGLEWNVKYKTGFGLTPFVNGSYHKSKILSKTLSINGTEVVVKDPADSKNRPLFVPSLTVFAGSEYEFAAKYRANLGVRSIQNIPYFKENGEEALAQGTFLDASLIADRFYGPFSASISVTNAQDSQPDLPAYGEHMNNRQGTIKPDTRRYLLRLSADI